MKDVEQEIKSKAMFKSRLRHNFKNQADCMHYHRFIVFTCWHYGFAGISEIVALTVEKHSYKPITS